MKKMISKRIYNTDTAVRMGGYSVGQYGEATGYEEALYQTRKGDYFLYGNGGADSKYPEETIAPVTEKEAKAFLKSVR